MAFLPPGIRLVAIPPAVIVYHGLDIEPAYIDVGPMLARNDLANAGYNILSAVQDYVVRDTTTRWPAWGTRFALPQVKLVDGGVHLWYGTETEIALDLGIWSL